MNHNFLSAFKTNTRLRDMQTRFRRFQSQHLQQTLARRIDDIRNNCAS